MKKFALLLLSGSIITLAACGGNENNSTQAQIDSAATARSAAMEADMKAKNDSLINEMAKMRADSAMKAEEMAKGNANTATATTKSGTKTVKTTAPAKTQKQKDQDSKFQQMGGDAGTKKTTTTDISKEKKQEQDDKFKQMGGQ